MIGERFAEARKRAGLSQVDLAVAMGERYDAPMISNVEAGRRSIRLDGLANAARELQVSTDYLLGLTDDPTPYSHLVRRLAQLDALEHEIGDPSGFRIDVPSVEIQGGSDLADTRYAEIHEVEAAAGNERLVDDVPIQGHLAFQRDWLRRNRINANRCTVIKVHGDSMEPTLPDGCSILVDHSRRTRRRGRIYVLQNEDSVMVKRAGREKSGWLILSDNPYWPVAPWPEGAEVIGEVRWAGRTF